jgi:hypothetical protein
LDTGGVRVYRIAGLARSIEQLNAASADDFSPRWIWWMRW